MINIAWKKSGINCKKEVKQSTVLPTKTSNATVSFCNQVGHKKSRPFERLD
jgi:hypothetical protein